jgi:hypothetical protein
MLCQCGCGKPAPISDKTDRKYGWTKGKPKRFIVGHRAKLTPRADTFEKAWDRLIRPKIKRSATGCCWLYTGTVDAAGYGSVLVGGAAGKRTKVHRIAYAIFNGPLVDGLFVMHSCDEPSCVNPAHLSLGTCADNQRDMARKGRSYHGERHHMAKVTSDIVRAIRAERAAGARLRVLAGRYGISEMAVSDIARRKKWAHV